MANPDSLLDPPEDKLQDYMEYLYEQAHEEIKHLGFDNELILELKHGMKIEVTIELERQEPGADFYFSIDSTIDGVVHIDHYADFIDYCEKMVKKSIENIIEAELKANALLTKIFTAMTAEIVTSAKTYSKFEDFIELVQKKGFEVLAEEFSAV